MSRLPGRDPLRRVFGPTARRVRKLVRIGLSQLAPDVAQAGWTKRVVASGLKTLRDAPGEAALREAVARLGGPASDGTAAEWFARLERHRAELLQSDSPIFVDSSGPSAEMTTVAEVCGRTSKRPPWTGFLYDIVRAEQPDVILEMGTSVGISGAHLGAALVTNGHGRLITLEGRPDVAAVAERGFTKLGLPVKVIVGRFGDTLQSALSSHAPIDLMFIDGNHHEKPTIQYFNDALPYLSERALVVFDDIRWSDGMERAWKSLRTHFAVETAVDLREIGLLRLKARGT